MADGRTAGQTLYESDESQADNAVRIHYVLVKIVGEGKITASDNNIKFEKVNVKFSQRD